VICRMQVTSLPISAIGIDIILKDAILQLNKAYGA
jgi:hypothetical protein